MGTPLTSLSSVMNGKSSARPHVPVADGSAKKPEDAVSRHVEAGRSDEHVEIGVYGCDNGEGKEKTQKRLAKGRKKST